MDSINNTIHLTLEGLGVKPDSIDNKIMGYLINIEIIMTNIFETQQRLVNEMKINKPSVLKITSEAKLARATVYNNTLLKTYIESRVEQFNLIDLFNKINKLSSHISDLEGVINKMEERDVKEELLKYKINNLDNELNLREKQNAELHEKYINAVKRINELEMSNSKKEPAKTINITQKNK